MSQNYYQKFWKETANGLRKNLGFEGRIKKGEPFQDETHAKWLIGHLFVNYVQIGNKLDKCYDQMIHPQKRELIGRLLDLTLGRLLELKADLVKIELDNFCFLDDVLIELKLTHDDLEIQVPRYFRKDREKMNAHRKKLINLVFEEAEKEKFKINYLKNVPDEGKEEAWQKYLAKIEQERIEKEKLEEQQKKMLGGKTTEMSSLEKLIKEMKDGESRLEDEKLLAEAVLLLQRHERARQGRTRATWAEKYKRLKEQGAFARKIPDKMANKAARVIQLHWRRHAARLRKQRKEEKLMEFLGMAETSFKDTAGETQLLKTEHLMRKYRERNQREFEQAFDPVKQKVADLYSTQMEDDIAEEIRSWFQWHFEMSNYLPDFPPEDLVMPTGQILGVPKVLGTDFADKAFPRPVQKPEEMAQSTALGTALCGLSAIGGSALVTAGHWIGPQEFLVCQKEVEKGTKDAKGGNAKEAPKADKDKVQGKGKKEPNPGFQLRNSNFVVPLKKAERDFRVTWSDLDESKNYEQRYLYSMLKDEKCWEVSMEVRKIVDDIMRLELEILKDALERDKNPGKKRKPAKNPKPKKEKTNKPKKDMTGDRTLDDLFMELFRNGIIRDYEEVEMKDYVGERSYCAFEFRRRNQEWPPSPGDVRDVVLQNCILPLGSARIHQLAPLVKSVCLLGTDSSGKEFLARIICSETAAVMFDLSPSNVVGKYPGKNGLKMLEHLVEKMSRVLQPSVIFVNATEKTFYKKVPKEEKDSDPKRMAGIVQKLAKGIKATDQVLVLGTCSQPWLANRNKLLKTYQQLIYVPQMDYASYFKIWQKLVTPRHCISRMFDVSALARASNGFPLKAIIETAEDIFSIQRISISRFYPLKPAEFLEELMKRQPYDDVAVDKCINFYNGTDLPKKRTKKLQQIKEELEKAKKKG